MVLDWYNVSIQRIFKFCLEKLEKRYEEMNYKKRRDEVLSKMEKNSVLVLYSGVRHHVSADEYAPLRQTETLLSYRHSPREYDVNFG